MKNHDRNLEDVAWELYDSLDDGAEKVKVLTLLFKLRGHSKPDEGVDLAEHTRSIVRSINTRKS